MDYIRGGVVAERPDFLVAKHASDRKLDRGQFRTLQVTIFGELHRKNSVLSGSRLLQKIRMNLDVTPVKGHHICQICRTRKVQIPSVIGNGLTQAIKALCLWVLRWYRNEQ